MASSNQLQCICCVGDVPDMSADPVGRPPLATWHYGEFSRLLGQFELCGFMNNACPYEAPKAHDKWLTGCAKSSITVSSVHLDIQLLCLLLTVTAKAVSRQHTIVSAWTHTPCLPLIVQAPTHQRSVLLNLLPASKNSHVLICSAHFHAAVSMATELRCLAVSHTGLHAAMSSTHSSSAVP
jgi:hypothetical protein